MRAAGCRVGKPSGGNTNGPLGTRFAQFVPIRLAARVAPPMVLYVQRDQPQGVPPLSLTGERTLPDVPEENHWFRRHLAVYEWIAARAHARPSAAAPAAIAHRRAHAARRPGGELLVPAPSGRLRVDRRARSRAPDRRPR